jgi:hypothetical protein
MPSGTSTLFGMDAHIRTGTGTIGTTVIKRRFVDRRSNSIQHQYQQEKLRLLPGFFDCHNPAITSPGRGARSATTASQCGCNHRAASMLVRARCRADNRRYECRAPDRVSIIAVSVVMATSLSPCSCQTSPILSRRANGFTSSQPNNRSGSTPARLPARKSRCLELRGHQRRTAANVAAARRRTAAPDRDRPETRGNPRHFPYFPQREPNRCGRGNRKSRRNPREFPYFPYFP